MRRTVQGLIIGIMLVSMVTALPINVFAVSGRGNFYLERDPMAYVYNTYTTQEIYHYGGGYRGAVTAYRITTGNYNIITIRNENTQSARTFTRVSTAYWGATDDNVVFSISMSADGVAGASGYVSIDT